MTKSQLIEMVSERFLHLPKRDVESSVDTVFSSMIDSLKKEERIEIRGFGSFAVRHRTAREGRNPKTGEKVLVPRKRFPFFMTGKELRDRINGLK